jgi:hypothetical protein
VHVRRKSAAVFVFLFAVVLAACLPAVAAAVDQQQLTLTADPATITCGSVTTLTLQGAEPGETVTLLRQRASEDHPVTVAQTEAGPDGVARFKVKPPETTLYQAQQTGGFAELTVGVRPRVTLTASAPTPLIETQRVRYTVSVRPIHAAVTVHLTRWTGDGWEQLKDVTLGSDSRGTVRLPAGKPGKLAVRAEMEADAEHLAGHSAPWKQTVFDKSNPYGVPARYAHLILVDLSKYKLYYYERGVVVRVFDCVLGRPSLPTPKGHYKIYAKDPHMGGPYGPYRMRYLGLYAIHGTNEPWLLGRYPRNYSHGCTRLSNGHITWLYSRVTVGTPVWNVP